MFTIKSTEKLKRLMNDYFTSRFKSFRKASGLVRVGPAELLRSFGFEVYFRNHGALLGATRSAMDYIPASIKCGYSNHICSYTTSDIGSFLSKKTPLEKQYGLTNVPSPSLIVYNTNQCREVEDWFSFTVLNLIAL